MTTRYVHTVFDFISMYYSSVLLHNFSIWLQTLISEWCIKISKPFFHCYIRMNKYFRDSSSSMVTCSQNRYKQFEIYTFFSVYPLLVRHEVKICQELYFDYWTYGYSVLNERKLINTAHSVRERKAAQLLLFQIFCFKKTLRGFLK
jgi:hypothetical protein